MPNSTPTYSVYVCELTEKFRANENGRESNKRRPHPPGKSESLWKRPRSRRSRRHVQRSKFETRVAKPSALSLRTCAHVRACVAYYRVRKNSAGACVVQIYYHTNTFLSCFLMVSWKLSTSSFNSAHSLLCHTLYASGSNTCKVSSLLHIERDVNAEYVIEIIFEKCTKLGT